MTKTVAVNLRIQNENDDVNVKQFSQTPTKGTSEVFFVIS